MSYIGFELRLYIIVHACTSKRRHVACRESQFFAGIPSCYQTDVADPPTTRELGHFLCIQYQDSGVAVHISRTELVLSSVGRSHLQHLGKKRSLRQSELASRENYPQVVQPCAPNGESIVLCMRCSCVAQTSVQRGYLGRMTCAPKKGEIQNFAPDATSFASG